MKAFGLILAFFAAVMGLFSALYLRMAVSEFLYGASKDWYLPTIGCLVLGLIAWGAYYLCCLFRNGAGESSNAPPMTADNAPPKEHIAMTPWSSMKTAGIILLFILSIPGFFVLQMIFRWEKRDKEAAPKVALGALRSALDNCRRDKGLYPDNLDALTIGGEKSRYLMRVPGPAIPFYHGSSAAVQLMTEADYRARKFTDTGGWAYVVDGPNKGTILLNCTHTDSRGSAWSSY